METCIDIIDRETCYISTDDRALYGKIRKLAEENPNGMKVIKEPEDNDGTLYAVIPSEWVRIGRKRKLELTDEQRAERAERLKNSLLTIRNEEKNHDSEAD